MSVLETLTLDKAGMPSGSDRLTEGILILQNLTSSYEGYQFWCDLEAKATRVRTSPAIAWLSGRKCGVAGPHDLKRSVFPVSESNEP